MTHNCAVQSNSPKKRSSCAPPRFVNLRYPNIVNTSSSRLPNSSSRSQVCRESGSCMICWLRLQELCPHKADGSCKGSTCASLGPQLILLRTTPTRVSSFVSCATISDDCWLLALRDGVRWVAVDCMAVRLWCIPGGPPASKENDFSPCPLVLDKSSRQARRRLRIGPLSGRS
eukprot:3432677-Amphidinium_carterae.1